MEPSSATNGIPANPGPVGTTFDSGTVTVLCQATQTYACVNTFESTGYSTAAATNGQWPGLYYGVNPGHVYASRSPNGDYHNCTLYAAYRLQQNGYNATSSFGNASQWAADAPTGVAVNQTPAVGAIAQWNGVPSDTAGHVAYVEKVTATGIDITEDNYVPATATAFPGGYTAALKIDFGSSDFPDNFIHFRDVATAPAPVPVLSAPSVSPISPGTLLAVPGSIGASQASVGGTVSLAGASSTTYPVQVAHWGPSGLIIWIPATTPASSTGTDYTLMLSDSGGSTSVPITLTAPTDSTQVVVPLLGQASLPLGVAEDQAGDVWFADGATDAIGELTTSGTVREYPLPAGSGPTGIAIDQAGNVWVSEKLTGQVARLDVAAASPGTADGETQITLASGARPDGVSVDPFGNVWVAEGGNGVLAEIPAGASAPKEWAIGGDPEGMVTDGFGNVWVVDESSGVDEIVPSELPAPTTASPVSTGVYPVGGASNPIGGGTEQLALAPNGDIWFTQWGPPVLGVIVPSSTNPARDQWATVANYPATGGAPSGIAVDAAGNVWVADAQSMSIYELQPTSIDTAAGVSGTWRTFAVGSWITNYSEGDEGNNLIVTPSGDVRFTGYVTNGGGSGTPYGTSPYVEGYLGDLPGVAATAATGSGTVDGTTTSTVTVGSGGDSVVIPAGTTVTTVAGTPFDGTIPAPVSSPSFVPPASFGTAVTGSAFTVSPEMVDGVSTHVLFSKAVTVRFSFPLPAGTSATEAAASTVWYYDPSTLTWQEVGTHAGDPGGTVTVSGGTVTVTVQTMHLSSFALLKPSASTPVVSAVDPSTVAPGGSVTITGSNLGSAAGTVHLVPVSGPAVSIVPSSWSATSVVAAVPSSQGMGSYSLSLTTSTGVATNSVSLTVASPAPPSSPGGVQPVSSAPPVTVPGAPKIGSVAAGPGGTVTVTWSAPASDGGSVVTGYRIVPAPAAATATGTLVDGAARSATVANLVPGTTYTFTVVAVNTVGSSDPSAPSPPVTIPATAAETSPVGSTGVKTTGTPGGGGYWEVASDGGVFAFGDARYFGSMGGRPLSAPVVGLVGTSGGGGYWEVASDGGVFAFGDARYFGSMGGRPLARPVVGLTVP